MLKDRGGSGLTSPNSPTNPSGGDVPEGVSFDGVTDYLSRSTDLVGNVDSKTFTFSCWVYLPEFVVNPAIFVNGYFRVRLNLNNKLKIECFSSGGTQVCFEHILENTPINTFFNLCISGDMSSGAVDIYLDDYLLSSPSSVGNYNIGFQETDLCTIMNYAGYLAKGRLSHIFLDYTYRDLSIEANRRLFITADGKPADGLASLNPILYLPMKDAATAHVNYGTGGSFVQNGTLATADRGANQDNCVASKFDGVDDYLRRLSMTATDNKTITLSFSFLKNNTTDTNYIYCSSTSTSRTHVLVTATSYNQLVFDIQNIGGIKIAHFVTSVNSFIEGKNYNLNISIDLSDVNKRHVFVNGQSFLVEWSDYTNANIPFSGRYHSFATTAIVGALFGGSIGEIYITNEYIDLATNNPFWDSETNKPIPVRKAMANLGSNPLICMPLNASNPGKNYGSGGDFTLNGGGLVGARGASEYIARSASTSTPDNTNLHRTSLVGATSTKTLSVVCSVMLKDSRFVDILRLKSLGSTKFYITFESANIQVKNSGNTIAYSNSTANANDTWYTIFICFDTANLVKYVYLGNTDITNTGSGFYYLVQDTVIDLPTIDDIDVFFDGYDYGVMASNYITTDYIDFSQEVNRNKFVNQLGYPRDLKPLIDSGEIPNPLIYLPFDEPTNLGKNLGTGGDFSVVGSVTAGADFAI